MIKLDADVATASASSLAYATERESSLTLEAVRPQNGLLALCNRCCRQEKSFLRLRRDRRSRFPASEACRFERALLWRLRLLHACLALG